MSESFIPCYLKYKRPLEAARPAGSVQSGFRRYSVVLWRRSNPRLPSLELFSHVTLLCERLRLFKDQTTVNRVPLDKKFVKL